jgi:hypothetical protein
MKARENIELVRNQVSEEEENLKAFLAELEALASNDIQRANLGTHAT